MTSLFEKLQIPTVEETDVSEVTEVIPTNIIPLDIALGIGGFPRGRLSAIVGTYSTGKSSIGVILARNNLRLGGKTLIIDTEFTYEKFRLTQFNVPIKSKDIAVLQNWRGDVLTAEKTESILITTLKVAKPEDKLLIVWDTISSTPLEAELTEREDKDKLMGRHSRILSRLLRTIPKDIAEKNVTIVMIVQPKIDPMTGTTTYLGEKPIKFHSSILVNLSRYSKDESKMVVGFDVQKNKCAPPFTKGKFTLYLHSGIDYISGWDAAVGKATAFYQLGDVSVKRTESGLLLLKKKTLIETMITEKLFRRIPYRILLEENDVYAYRPTTNDTNKIKENDVHVYQLATNDINEIKENDVYAHQLAVNNINKIEDAMYNDDAHACQSTTNDTNDTHNDNTHNSSAFDYDTYDYDTYDYDAGDFDAFDD